MVWSFINQVTDSQLFADTSSLVVSTILCEGLSSLNYTVWEALANATDSATFESSCNVPQESFCNATYEQHAVEGLDYESAMNSLVVSYEKKYLSAMEPAVICIEKSNSDLVINHVFGQATSSLQNTLGTSMQTSWSIPFQMSPNANEAISIGNVNDQIKNLINNTLNSELAEKLVTEHPILNDTEILNKISPPVLSSSYDIIQIQGAAKNLITVVFAELDTMLIDVKEAVDSNLVNLPSYLNLPELPSSSLCQNIWVSRPNATVLVDTINSTEDFYCRSELTACTIDGICLIGLKIDEDDGGSRQYTPFQFNGRKCQDYPMTKKIMDYKEEIGALQIYIPGTFV